MAARKKVAKKKAAKKKSVRKTVKKSIRKSAPKSAPKSAKSKTARRPAAKKAAKRELIDTGRSKQYVRRNALGTSFVESDNVGRSLAADRRSKARTVAKRGQGDRGDRRR